MLPYNFGPPPPGPATAKNCPYFHQRESKVPDIYAAPTIFSFETFMMVFFGVIFSSVVQIFCFIGFGLIGFGANFLRDWCALPRPVTYFTVWPGSVFFHPTSPYQAQYLLYLLDAWWLRDIRPRITACWLPLILAHIVYSHILRALWTDFVHVTNPVFVESGAGFECFDRRGGHDMTQ